MRPTVSDEEAAGLQHCDDIVTVFRDPKFADLKESTVDICISQSAVTLTRPTDRNTTCRPLRLAFFNSHIAT